MHCDVVVDRIVVEIDGVKNATTFDEPTHRAAISKHLFGRRILKVLVCFCFLGVSSLHGIYYYPGAIHQDAIQMS